MAAEEAFSKPEELLNHLKVSHPGQQPECPKCKASFDFDDYISHLVSAYHFLAISMNVRPWLRDPAFRLRQESRNLRKAFFKCLCSTCGYVTSPLSNTCTG